MVESKREIIIGTILIILGFIIIFIVYPVFHIFITGESIYSIEYLEVIELSFRIIFLIMILISVLSTKSRVSFIKRSYKLFIIEVIICEVFIMLFTPINIILYPIYNFIFTIIVLSFGARGIILQEDEKARNNWEIRRGYSIIGSIIMVIFITILSSYLIFFFFIPYYSGLPVERLSLISTHEAFFFLNRTVSTSVYRLSFFLFFISGISSGRNIRKIKGVKQAFFFIFSLLSIFLAILDGIFNLTFRWSFLFFFSLYFGFFFIFQSTIFFINTIQASRNNEIYMSKGTLIIMWSSLLWLISMFFIFENLEVLTEFPSNIKNWVFWIFLWGFCLSFLNREDI